MTVADTHYYGNGSALGQSGRLLKVKAIRMLNPKRASAFDEDFMLHYKLNLEDKKGMPIDFQMLTITTFPNILDMISA